MAWGDTGYEAHKQRNLEQQREKSQAGRDIGPLPDVHDPARKEACRYDFKLFCETYFPELFSLGWSEDHIRVIDRIEDAVLRGGTFAMAMPRGSGKTTLCEVAAVWAIVYGHRLYVMIVGADKDSACSMLESLKIVFANNETLGKDFPEACYPIASLEGISHRAKGQLLDGENTSIVWTSEELRMPKVKDSACSESIVQVAGITGRIRGAKSMRSDGVSMRPDLVLIDDPQTDESGRSPSQCRTREATVAGAILGLAGPGKKIAGLMTMTVIRADDMADNILDREKHPQWQGERTKMLYDFPKDMKLWEEYNELRNDGLRKGEGVEVSNEFYRTNFDAMNEGGKVAWEDRKNEDELTGLQHAMNLFFRDKHSFFAEYQNEPIDDEGIDAGQLTTKDVYRKINNMPRALVPAGTTKLTAFIDVQKYALYYCVVAWEDEFTGSIIDYGTDPEQSERYFVLRDLRRTLHGVYRKDGDSEAIYAGLQSLEGRVLGKVWEIDGGGEMTIDRCMIDANWGASTDVVYLFCRQSEYRSILIPSHGKYYGASSVPMDQKAKKKGDRVGTNWRIPGDKGERAIRHIVYDTNYWKSFIQSRLKVSLGGSGCLSIFGTDARQHEMLADHLTSEASTRTEGRGRTVDEWKLKVGGRDNHLLDCVVGCAVAGSEQGIRGVGHSAVKGSRKRERQSFAELQRKHRG